MKALKYLSCILLFAFQTISAQNFWQQTNGPYGQVDDICLTRSGYILANTHWDGLQWSSNNGESWTSTNITGVNPYSIETINDSIFIAGKDHIYVSNDFGNTWFIPADFGILGYHSILYDSTSQTLYAGSESWANGICGIYSSNDSGQNWDLINSFPIIAERQSINALWVTRTNNIILVNVLYAWSFSGHSKFLKSSDYGQTWELIVQGHNNIVYQIIEDISSNLYAICNNGLMISEDGGNTWVTRNISQSTSLATDFTGRIYLGLSFSTDKGNTWFDLPISGFQAGFREDMAINHSNRIYTASSDAIFYGEADSLVVSVEKIEPTKTFYLFQNFPNPFNPSTKIKYEIPNQDRNDNRLITLKVYDVLGNEVATLVNEEKQPGTYEVEFNMSSLKQLPSSGIYFYQLKAGDFVETKKMILLK